MTPFEHNFDIECQLIFMLLFSSLTLRADKQPKGNLGNQTEFRPGLYERPKNSWKCKKPSSKELCVILRTQCPLVDVCVTYKSVYLFFGKALHKVKC